MSEQTPNTIPEVTTKMVPNRGGFFDKPVTVKFVLITLYVLCAIVFGLEFLIDRHGGHPWEELFGFHALYGFVVCVILVLIAKELRKILRRSEGYYDREDDG